MKVTSILLASSLPLSTAFFAGVPQRRSSWCPTSLASEQDQEEDVGDVLFGDGSFPDFRILLENDLDDLDDKVVNPNGMYKPNSLKLSDPSSSAMKQSDWIYSRKKVKERNVDSRTESKQDKKRRMMMFVKSKERERKRASRVERKIPLTMRTPLSALQSGAKMTGVVISLTQFGVYVDIGSECDGLLHISQISNTVFIDNLKKHFTPGQEIEVTIKSLNPEKKKLHLTLLSLQKDNKDDDDDDEDDDDKDRISLDDMEVDDELWGEIVRVTDYGSYVELGAEATGFLHFMDHPLFGAEPGAHPSTYMSVGDRVRVWVADVDRERHRIKLTANRPTHLPGPRRDL